MESININDEMVYGDMKSHQLSLALNAISIITAGEDIDFLDHRKITSLLKQKENLIQADCWDYFITSDTSQSKIFKKLGLDAIDEELYTLISNMKGTFNNLKVSFTKSKIEYWTKKIVKQLSAFNMFDRFFFSTHKYFKYYQDIIKNKNEGLLKTEVNGKGRKSCEYINIE